MAQTFKEECVYQTLTRRISITCDLCGKPGDPLWKWANSSYDAEEVTVSHRTGYRYPECGETSTESFDICPECFEKKLVPWLESQGARASVEKSEF